MRLLAASFLLPALAAPALAQDTDRPFEGASATPITGIDRSSAFGESGTGVIYRGQLGYDIPSGKAVFGVEGRGRRRTSQRAPATRAAGAPTSASERRSAT